MLYLIKALRRQKSRADALIFYGDAIAGFIIPFMFVFGNELLFKGNTPSIVLAFITAAFGVGMLAATVQGWCIGFGKINYLERGLLLGASLLLMKPGWITDVVGVCIVLALYFWKWQKGTSVEPALSKTE